MKITSTALKAALKELQDRKLTLKAIKGMFSFITVGTFAKATEEVQAMIVELESAKTEGDELKPMTEISAEKAAEIKAMNPLHLGLVINQNNQAVRLYECPVKGQSASIIAEINGAMAYTGFNDIDDFYHESDYTPCMASNGKMYCCFEMAKANKAIIDSQITKAE